MLIWGAMAIPVIAILILLLLFNKKMVLWEYGVVLIAPVLFIFAFKLAGESSLTRDTEYWNSYGTQITYYEKWDEYIHKTCERCHEECSGSGESRSCHQECESYDCSYVEDHPPYWQIEDNLGSGFRTDKQTFDTYCQLWGNKTFKDMHRHYHSYDGDAYFTKYNNDTLKIISLTLPHSYENRVQAAKSIYKFETVTEKEALQLGLFKYPENFDAQNFPYILGDNNQKATKLIKYYNAKYGAVKKLHFMILVFKNKPESVAYKQESYWNGGNKNEFILCIGVDNVSKISWTKIITWGTNERLKVDVNADVFKMHDYNLENVVRYAGDIVTKKFIKKSFKEFSYLSVEVPFWAILTTYIVTLVITVGVCVFVIMNDIDSD